MWKRAWILLIAYPTWAGLGLCAADEPGRAAADYHRRIASLDAGYLGRVQQLNRGYQEERLRLDDDAVGYLPVRFHFRRARAGTIGLGFAFDYLRQRQSLHRDYALERGLLDRQYSAQRAELERQWQQDRLWAQRPPAELPPGPLRFAPLRDQPQADESPQAYACSLSDDRDPLADLVELFP